VPAGAGAQHSACKTPGEAPPGDADHDGPDDCFSCSHYVDVQVRFQITLVYTSVSAVFARQPQPSLPRAIRAVPPSARPASPTHRV